MVGKLKAAMDAKLELDPDFVIMARCDFGGVPGVTFEEIIERCLAYKEEAKVDVVCPNDLKTWDEIQEAIRRIPGPVVPLIPASIRPYPTLEQQQAAGAAAWFPALTTMAGLQANWDFLNDFRERGTRVIDDLLAQAAQSKWGATSNASILGARRIQDRSYWIPGSYAPMLSENHDSFFRLLKNKDFKEERMTKVELYAISTSTTLESNKSLAELLEEIQ
jgi:hypothetical protein